MIAPQIDKDSIPISSANDSTRPLSEHVRYAVDGYFSQLNGHDSSGLYALVLAEVEKPLLETALKHANYNQTKTAKILGLSRSTLRKKLDQYGIS
ncbi:helix-turn-helix domain-containing protein [Methylomarinum sp. Ch1-1]|uniref:Putative Fis-like DNA-binding protein n=1 Tax=Methylomarinum roseum TaxID=3067653 RepID=A0AAU7NXJ7_9GAMM|nr:helix-turn-helix domain-containing protein [Methylomarinum sp. Ch1-1]MDP4522264.1 helix-turn-helix domain-containing protein [Methylomarinum sp. Ch1-1]